MPRPANLLRYTHRPHILVLGTLALALAVWGVLALRTRPGRLSETPELALAALQAKSLYFNERARPWLLSLRPDLLTPEDHENNSERTRQFVRAVQNPKLFRQLDRQYRFDALLLTGDPSEYKPLLDHLITTKDWSLRYVDHTSLVFRREEGQPWNAADFEPVRRHFAKEPADEQAAVRALTATKLIAAGQPEAGKQLLDEAVPLAPRNPWVANGLATYHLGRGEWREAAEQVRRALAADKDFLPALATQTQLLYGTRHFSEAYDLSRRLLARLPDNPGLLFYHAKIAHEAHAYKAEIEALEKLIAQAMAADHPVGGYQLYLGQAYASAGDATRAVDAFMLALNDANLPDDQRAFARDNIARIKKRTGL
jgi:Tfp pilus assembly protein PilF